MVTLSAHNCGVKGDTWSKWNRRVCLWSQQSSRIGTQRERVCSDTFKQTNKWNTLSFNETQSQSERWETSEIPFVLCRPRIYFLQTSSCGDIQKHVCGFPHSSNTLFGINVQFVDFLKCKDFLYTRVLWMWLTGRLLQSRWFKFQKVLMLWNFMSRASDSSFIPLEITANVTFYAYILKYQIYIIRTRSQYI